MTDHLGVFAANGFTVAVDQSQPPTKRCRLVAVPFSQKQQFDVNDVRELAALIVERGEEADAEALAALRLPKLRAMFASRACRASIMIGTALGADEMRRLAAKMGTIDAPWNCPHGRPTMRHLLDLRDVAGQAESR